MLRVAHIGLYVVGITFGVVVAAILGVALAAGLWWAYFDVVSTIAGERPAETRPASRTTTSAATPGRTSTSR